MEINADPRTNIGQSSRNCAGEEGRGIVGVKGVRDTTRRLTESTGLMEAHKD